MRKVIYSIVAFAMSATSAFAQYGIIADMTSKIANADFGADEVVTATIRTYDYDMTDDGIGNGGVEMFGQQQITGWTALTPSDNIKVSTSSNDARTDGLNARAAGVFAYVDDSEEPTFGLGGNYYPGYTSDAPAGSNLKALGMIAVWGASLQYTQDVTLPAGAYMLVMPIFNSAGTGNITKNLNGFITEDAEYLSEKVNFPTYLENDTIIFTLDKETAGKVSIGYAGPGGSSAMPHLFYDCVKLYQINQADVDRQQALKEKVNLLDAINEGKEIGADTKAAQAVYNNENATLAEVLKAIADQKAINAASQVDLSESFIMNPHFNQDDAIVAAEGAEFPGICTYDYDRSKNNVLYYGMQPVSGWVANRPAATIEDNPVGTDTGVNNGQASGVAAIGSGAWIGGADYIVPGMMSDGSTEGKVLGFVACWTSRAQYTQAVSIPAGKYTLTISYFNTGGTEQFAKNLMGFIADDGTEYLSDIKQFEADGKWHQMKIVFELNETTSGNFTLGYEATNVGSAKMPHFFIDGISLNYVGDFEFDPSLFALRAAIQSADKAVQAKFNEDLKSQLEDALETAKELSSSNSSDATANKAATDAINTLMSAVNANIAAYSKLKTFADVELQETYEKYQDVEAITDLIEPIIDGASEALEEYTLTTEEINALMASLKDAVKNGTQTAWDAAVKSGEELDEALDITPVLSGLTFESSAEGWTSDNGSVSIEHGCGEIYNKSPFTVTRTIENMPAGTYTVKTRAFYRTANNDINYAEYQENKAPKAFIWAGHHKNGIANVVELAVEADAAPSNYALADGNIYVPNNRTVGQQIFEDKSIEVVETSAQTVLAEAGNLNFGICAEELAEGSWVVWYSFEIAYNAVNNDILDEDIENFRGEINEYIENNADMISAPVSDDASSKVDAATLPELDAIYTALKENVAAAQAINDAIDKANTAAEMYGESASSAVMDSYSAIAEKADSWQEMSTEEIKAVTKELVDITALMRIPDTTGASDDNEINMTSVIVNPDFEDNNYDGWTLVKGEGASGNYQTQNGFDGGKSMEFWSNTNGSGTKFNFFQEINNLPAGTYELKADLANSLNGQTAGPGEGGVYLYAATGAGEKFAYVNDAPVTIQEAGCADAYNNYSVIFTLAEGETLRIGVMNVGELSARWAMVDNFTLAYFGNESSKTASEGNETVIKDVNNTVAASAIYTLTGAKVNALQKGLNIVVKNGKATKILVK